MNFNFRISANFHRIFCKTYNVSGLGVLDEALVALLVVLPDLLDLCLCISREIVDEWGETAWRTALKFEN